MKKEMKDNYYKDENKYFDRPGRRYNSNESSYHTHRESEGGDRQGSSGNGDRRGPRNNGGGQYRNRQFSQRDDYVDYDDPEVNANM